MQLVCITLQLVKDIKLFMEPSSRKNSSIANHFQHIICYALYCKVIAYNELPVSDCNPLFIS